MKLLVLGANGKTGKALVQQATALGHEVTAFVHDASEAEATGFRVVEGDVLDQAKLTDAVAGQDAVLDALGGKTPWKQTGMEQQAARNVITAMRTKGVRRLIVTSAMGVGESAEQANFLYEHILLPTFLRGAMKDKAEMESAVEASDLDWILVRPAALTDGDAMGSVKVYELDSPEKAHKISRADVAAFMLAQLTSDTYLHQAVTIATE